MTLNHTHHQLPLTSGVGLKPQHYQTILETKPDIGWFECHPENYMGDGGLPHYYLSKITEQYPISMHGVGLSLGSADGLDQLHLNKLAKVVSDYQPAQVSEHLAWSHWNQIFLNDLLPIPYTNDFLDLVTSNVIEVQDKLKRTILVENPSAYLGFNHSEMTETDFLHELVKKTGCGLLLDVNNVYVSAHNQQFSITEYIDNYPLDKVSEIHLAGHAKNKIENGTILIDDHGSPIIEPVWELFKYTIEKIGGSLPVLIEWDTDIPDLAVLLNEADEAKRLMSNVLKNMAAF